jgi:hypothetical protein
MGHTALGYMVIITIDGADDGHERERAGKVPSVCKCEQKQQESQVHMP